MYQYPHFNIRVEKEIKTIRKKNSMSLLKCFINAFNEIKRYSCYNGKFLRGNKILLQQNPKICVFPQICKINKKHYRYIFIMLFLNVLKKHILLIKSGYDYLFQSSQHIQSMIPYVP